MTHRVEGHVLQFRNGSEDPDGTGGGGRTFFSRDINYVRDVVLFWPFVLFLIVAVRFLYAPDHRQTGLKALGVAALAILLARERLLIFLAGLGFIALQGLVDLFIHPWSWGVLGATIAAGAPFLIANRYWRKPKLAYEVPREFGAVDMLVSFASICLALFIAYLISPEKF